MNTIKKIAALFLTAIMLSASTVSAQDTFDWENGIFCAVGIGAVQSENVDSPFFKMHMRQAARLAAFSGIADVLSLETESYENGKIIIGNSRIKSNDLRARQIKEDFYEDGTCEVLIEVDVWGEHSLAAEIFSDLKSRSKKPFPKPENELKTLEKYTGLIVDCRGLGFEPTFKPAIKNEQDRIILGIDNFDYAELVNGIAAYVKSGKSTRAGQNPLVVKAIAIDTTNHIAIVSNSDAELILNAEKNCGLLRRAAVVFQY